MDGEVRDESNEQTEAILTLTEVSIGSKPSKGTGYHSGASD